MSDILNLNKQPLKYIVTKNSNVITNSPFSKNTGSLIVYEPSNEDGKEIYRELWISNYFLASGFGAQSRDEQTKLSYIAKNYDSNYTYINTRINNTNTQLNSKFNELDNKKVSKGSRTQEGSDISYNVFNYGSDKIQLGELYDKIQDIHILHNFEIFDIQYKIKLSDGKEYENLSFIPIGLTVSELTITITGNTRDSGGIDNIQIDLYQTNSSNIYHLLLSDISDVINKPNTSNENFTFSFNKKFNVNNYYFKTYQPENDDKNYIIKNIIITTLPTPLEVETNNPLKAETLNNIIDKYPSYYIISKSLYVFSGLNTYSNNLNNYLTALIPQESNTYELFINQYSTDTIILLGDTNTNIRLIKAEYYDYKNKQTYDIIDFILSEYNQTINRKTYKFRYKIILDNNNASNYDSSMNLPFISKNPTDNKLYFNEGKIIFTFINSTDTTYINKLKNTDQYWISYNNNSNLPL